MVYFWGPTVRGPICHFFRADSWAPDNWAPGPNCPGPNLPLFQSGQLGPTVRGPICLEPTNDEFQPPFKLFSSCTDQSRKCDI